MVGQLRVYSEGYFGHFCPDGKIVVDLLLGYFDAALVENYKIPKRVFVWRENENFWLNWCTKTYLTVSGAAVACSAIIPNEVRLRLGL